MQQIHQKCFTRNRIRGRLASLLMLSVCTGILIGFVTVPYLPYNLVPKIFAPLPILFFIAFILFPETPHYFIERQNFDVSETHFLFKISLFHNFFFTDSKKNIKKSFPINFVSFTCNFDFT